MRDKRGYSPPISTAGEKCGKGKKIRTNAGGGDANSEFQRGIITIRCELLDRVGKGKCWSWGQHEIEEKRNFIPHKKASKKVVKDAKLTQYEKGVKWYWPPHGEGLCQTLAWGILG